MSTKTFDAQIAFGYLLAKTVINKGSDARVNLHKLAENIEGYLQDEENHRLLKETAKKLCKKKDIFLFGKYQNFHIVREGMVKLMEAVYKHGHALPSGDLKHYVITLMEKGVPVIVAVSEDKVKADLLSAIQQVKARGAEIIAITSQANKDYDTFLWVPDCGETSAIMNVMPLHLLAYYMAVEMGNNVDKPRNIAKSVTVK
jgi:glucosamine--fructose-6-phosphate aminotransferase (isomerizing)